MGSLPNAHEEKEHSEQREQNSFLKSARDKQSTCETVQLVKKRMYMQIRREKHVGRTVPQMLPVTVSGQYIFNQNFFLILKMKKKSF